jgi:hypothetical protein
MAGGRSAARPARRFELDGLTFGTGHVERRHPPVIGLGGVEAGVGHAQRAKDPLGEKLVERLARGDFDDPPEHIGRHRVVPLGARLEQQRHRRPQVAGLGQRHP